MFLWLTRTHEDMNTSKSCLFQNKQSHYYLVSQDVIKFCVKHRLTWQSVQLYKEKNPALLAVWSCIKLLSWCNKQHLFIRTLSHTLCAYGWHFFESRIDNDDDDDMMMTMTMTMSKFVPVHTTKAYRRIELWLHSS